jgi:hypothetical protein
MSLLFTKSYTRHGAYSIKILNLCYSLNTTDKFHFHIQGKKVVVLDKIEEAKTQTGL